MQQISCSPFLRIVNILSRTPCDAGWRVATVLLFYFSFWHFYAGKHNFIFKNQVRCKETLCINIKSFTIFSFFKVLEFSSWYLSCRHTVYTLRCNSRNLKLIRVVTEDHLHVCIDWYRVGHNNCKLAMCFYSLFYYHVRNGAWRLPGQSWWWWYSSQSTVTSSLQCTVSCYGISSKTRTVQICRKHRHHTDGQTQWRRQDLVRGGHEVKT